MNTIYKVIWNDALQVFQAVNEITKSHRKHTSVRTGGGYVSEHSDSHPSSLRLKAVAVAVAGAIFQSSGLLVSTPAMADEYVFNDLVLDLSSGVVTEETKPTINSAELPSAGDNLVINLDKTGFINVRDSLFTQDDGEKLIRLFKIQGEWSANGVGLVFRKDGQDSDDLTVDVDGQATFVYSMSGAGILNGDYVAGYALDEINLLATQGMGLNVNVSQYNTDDLKATLLGKGNITFGYSGENSDEGYLTLAGSDKNTYTGWTYVGYSTDGTASVGKTTIYFGKDAAFGDTANLDVESSSSVYIGGVNGDQAYSQEVHGLRGTGLIDLGSQATLTLDQSSQVTGNVSTEDGTIRVDNRFTGEDGAKYDIKLSGDVAGYEVWFSNNQSYYTGTISLNNGKIQAYNENRKVSVGDLQYTPNLILTTSTLRLDQNGQLLVDGTGSVHNLVINNSSEGPNSNELSFENVALGTGSLLVTGDLTLQQSATVNIDNFSENNGLAEAVLGKSFFDADDGLSNALIEVEGKVNLGDNKLALTGAATSGGGTRVTQNGQHVADATWEFSNELQYVAGSGDQNDSFNIEYTLTKLDILDGQEFTLETAEGSQSGQDFTALLTGSGDLVVNTNGLSVNIGHEGGNQYTGNTNVTNNSHVVLTQSGAFGKGEGALSIGDQGSVTLDRGVEQASSGLSGNGTLILNEEAKYSLTQNSSAAISNIIQGSGTFAVDLTNGQNSLQFKGNQAFGGILDLTNTTLDLSQNQSTLGQSHIVLNDGTHFSFGRGSTVAGLDVNEGADLNADTLIIGGDAVLVVNGELSFDSGRQFDISDVEVADNINLIDFDSDNGVISNNFIQANQFTSGVEQQFTINVNGSTSVDGKQQVIREYAQGTDDTRDVVAETTWLLNPSLTTSGNGLFAGVQLTQINVLNDKNLTLTGDENGKTLSALLSSESNLGGITFNGGKITVNNSQNDYSVKTAITKGTTVTLAQSNALGKTSELGVYGELILNSGISQTVFGWNSGANGLITLNGSLALEETDAVSIANQFTGTTGSLDIDLGKSENSLVFTARNVFDSYSGSLSLSNLTFNVADSQNYSSMLESTSVILNSGSIFNADATGSIQTGNFTFNGGSLLIGSVSAGDPTAAKLAVTGDINIGSQSQIILEGVELQGTDNILAADNGVKQTIASFTGDVQGNVEDLKVSGADASAIRNTSDGPVVAWGVWGNSGKVEEGNGTLDVSLTLQEIQLADTNTGLILDASSLGDSAEKTLTALISDYVDSDGTRHQGNIVFYGGNIVIGAAGNNGNTYTGETHVTGGTVTAGKNLAFGQTSNLLVDGAEVEFGSYSQNLGRLEVADDASISGSATLTLNGANKASVISSENSGFTGLLDLTGSNHSLTLNSVNAVGDSAQIQLGQTTSLLLKGVSGNFATSILGSGLVSINNGSTVELSGKNGNFTGNWTIEGNSVVTVNGTNENSADSILGKSGTITLAGVNDRLTLIQDSGEFSIDNRLAGNGQLVVLGTGNNQTFNFTTDWKTKFKGSMTIGKGVQFVVGNDLGASNASNLALANFIVNSGARLTVETGDNAVDTFKDLTLNNGTIAFEGLLGFGTTTNELAQLIVESLTIGEGALLDVKLPGTNGDLAGSIDQSVLLTTQGNTPFQTLITTANGVTGFENLSLNGGNTGSALQDIKDGNNTVATGHYDYQLAIDDNEKIIGVSYELTQVDIHDQEDLTLTGSSSEATLSAVLTGSASTDLIISGEAGSSVLLSGDNKDFLGTTTINQNATLQAQAGALGSTKNLIVSGQFQNLGANTVGGLSVNENAILDLGTSELTISEKSSDEGSVINGQLKGSGTLDLAVDGEGLTINSSNSEFGGKLIIGSQADAGVATITVADALGQATIEFGNTQSTFVIDTNTASTIQNLFSGSGTIQVDLGSDANAFAFASDSSDLTRGSDLLLSNTHFNLDQEANAAMASQLDITVGSGALLSNQGSSDRTIHGLTLNGGTVDFGILDDETGQFILTGGHLSVSADEGNETTVVFTTPDQTETGDRIITNGSNLLAGGLFDLTLVSGVTHFDGKTNENGQVIGLVTDERFEGSHETLLQDVNNDGANETVANLYRDDGKFLFDDEKNELLVQYAVRVIDLLYGEDGHGLTLNASGNLIAQVIGKGNIDFAGGNITVGSSSQDPNSYTGATYVRNGASVTLAQDSAFGQTKALSNDGTVIFNENVDQVVGSISGNGQLTLGANSTFTIDNSLYTETASNQITIGNVITGGQGATFSVDGAYDNGKANVAFTQTTNNLAGTTLELIGSIFDINGEDANYLTAKTSQDFVIGTGTEVNVVASATPYQFKELSFNNGTLSVSGVTLTPAGTTTNAIINTNVLDLRQEGQLSVSAKIDENFDVLKNDSDRYSQTLIHYDSLAEGSLGTNLKPDANLAASSIEQDGNVVAYIGWDGSISWGDNTVGMEYQVENIQLADDDGNGLTLSTDNTGEADASTLTAAIIDYKEVIHGNIYFKDGDITVSGEGSTYHGKTLVTANSVTATVDNAFGNTSLLQVDRGVVQFGDQGQTLGSLNIANLASISGSGQSNLYLGSEEYRGQKSTINGTSSNFSGQLTLQNGHQLTMTNAESLGTSGSFVLNDGTGLFIGTSGQSAITSGVLSKLLSGSGQITLNSSEISVTQNNRGFSGLWTVNAGSVLSAQSTDSITADDMLGTGEISLNDGADLKLTVNGNSVLDNVISGSGDVYVEGSSEGSFAFKTLWKKAFEGTLYLSGNSQSPLTMAVSEKETSSGYNADNLAQSDYVLGEGGRLFVESGSVVNTFDDLTFAGGSIAFDSDLSIRPHENFGSLKIGGALSVDQGKTANIEIDITNDQATDSLSNTAVLAAANQDAFLTLIDAETGEVNVADWTLNGLSNSDLSNKEISQAIVQGTSETVANAYYGYQLATSQGKTDLGVLYDMTRIEILDQKELNLTEEGTLAVAITDEERGRGDLLVSSGNLTLSGKNTFTGTTTVSGHLTAMEQGLGKTSLLIVNDQAAYTNAGDNVVLDLNVKGELNLNNDTTLTLSSGDGDIIDSATVKGQGTLVLKDGASLTVSVAGNASEFYEGEIQLGDQTSLILSAADKSLGLGVGLINAGEGSEILVNGNGERALTNTLAGSGTLNIDLSTATNLFRFKDKLNDKQEDAVFSGSLNLIRGTINLALDDVLSKAQLSTTDQSVVIVNSVDKVADRDVSGLTLDGGTLDFGSLSTVAADQGQLVVGGDLTLSEDNKTIVKVALTDLSDANGLSAFGIDQKLYLIEGYKNLIGDATTHFVLDAGSTNQVKQTVVQHNDDVANLIYSDGSFNNDESGVFVTWGLSQIELLSNEEGGYIVDASQAQGQSGSIVAQLIGNGDVTFASGSIQIGGNTFNTYTGSTYVNGAELTLLKDEALGDTKNLVITAGTTNFGSTTQTIGAIHVGESGHFVMTSGGSLTLGAGNSVIQSANTGAGSLLLTNRDTTLELQNADALGGLSLTAEEGTGVTFNFGTATDHGVLDNVLIGTGTYYVGDGENVAYVELTNTENDFDQIEVRELGHLFVNNMDEEKTALSDAKLTINGEGEATLAGSGAWTLDNALMIADGATLALSAGDSKNALNFGGSDQRISGTIALTDALLTLGGNDGTAGALNASVLTDATLRAGRGSSIHVVNDEAAQKVKGLVMQGGDLYFDGTLGVNVPTSTLGQLEVGSLTLQEKEKSKLHATASVSQGDGGSIAHDKVLDAQTNHLFQKLISITGNSGITTNDLENLTLLVTDEKGYQVEGITSDIVQGNDPDPVAIGTYGYDLALGDESGKTVGVSYTLQVINLLETLTIEETGDMTARLTGNGNLSVSQDQALTLVARDLDDESDWNDFKGETTVNGQLIAGAMTLGSETEHTSILTVNENGTFTNAGVNVIGSLISQGTMVLNDSLTVVGSSDTENQLNGALSGEGALNLQSGTTTVTNAQNNYEGAVTLGTSETFSSLTLTGHTSLGGGLITFANEDSSLSITNLTTTGALTNVLKGEKGGLVSVSGSNASFAFNADQSAQDLNGFEIKLNGVNYDFSVKGSDVLDSSSLSMTGGKLTVNQVDQTNADRSVNGLTLKDTTVDFGTMGPGTSGVIDLQGSVLSASNATLSFNTNLAGVLGDDGSAAMKTAPDTVTLVTNAQNNSTTGLTVSVAGNSSSSHQYAQAIYQGGNDPVAYIRGSVDDEVTAQRDETDSLYDFVASLTRETLEIVSEYVVSTSGEIALVISDQFDPQKPDSAGHLTVTGQGTELVLSHAGNTYNGQTSVKDGASLTLSANNALGNTSLLSVGESSSVSFGLTDQTIGAIDSEGSLTSAAVDKAGTLTVTNGGRVSGANNDFHMDIVLSGKSNEEPIKLVLHDVDALGDGTMTINETNNLVLSGLKGQDGSSVVYDNQVFGEGGLSIADASSVELTGDNSSFVGTLTVTQDSTVKASGDVFSHLGTGTLDLLSGQAQFTLTEEIDTNDWTWDKTVTGRGVLSLDRTQDVAQNSELIFTEDSIDNFDGTIALKNWGITLDANGSANTYTAIKNSGIHLTLGENASAVIDGNVVLNGKTITVDNMGCLTFTGVAAPGNDSSMLSKLTSAVLDLNDGFIINLSVNNDQSVKADSLLTQDDASGTTITVATATDRIDATVNDEGVLTGGNVTVNGSAVADDGSIRFDITQTSQDEAKNGKVAEGIYDVAITKDDKNLNISYGLEGVDILQDKTLVMAGEDDDLANSNNIFSGYITGVGNLEISSRVVTLTGKNSYTGETTVLDNAKLYAQAGSLGNEESSTSKLIIAGNGEAHVTGDNVVRGIDVNKGVNGNNGLLVIGSGYGDSDQTMSNVTLTLQSNESAGSRIDGRLEGNGNLRVVGNGSVDDIHPADLTIVGSQTDFYGGLELDDGAWVTLEADSNHIFGNESYYAKNEIQISKNSLLKITSILQDDADFLGVFVNGDSDDNSGVSRGGRIEVLLGLTDSQFKFSAGQASAGFNGVFALNRGTLDLGDLYWSSGVQGNALEEATLELGSEGFAQLGLNDESSTTDSFLGGLSFNGGTLAFGSLSYDAESDQGAHSLHVNLGGNGLLSLTTMGDSDRSTVTIEQGEVNTISQNGGELLAAADGALITLIHNIGGLVIDGVQVVASDHIGPLSNELLTLNDQTETKQVLAQKLEGFDDPQQVAEVVRTFDQQLTFGNSTITGEDDQYALSVGYTVNQVGLLFATDSITKDNYSDDGLWQGLNITVSDDQDNNNYQANIVDGSSANGNIVFHGQGDNVLTLSGNNTYHGKTWVTDSAQIAFGQDHAFGYTEALRVDDGSKVNFNQFNQMIGLLAAFGNDALQSSAESSLTIGGGFIEGANTALNSDITLTGDFEINNARALGSGQVTINPQVTLTVDGANGEMRNSFKGEASAAIEFIGSIVTSKVDAFKDYVGSLGIDGNSSLSLSMSQLGEFGLSSGSDVKGELALGNVSFDLDDNQTYLHSAHITANSGTKLSVSDLIGSDKIDHLTLNSGSTIIFEKGGVPGTVESPAHIDLGESGQLDLNGQMTVQINISDLVNPDLVKDAQDNLLNKPITSQDLFSDGTGATLVNLISGHVNKRQDWNGTLVVEAENGTSLDSEHQLTIGIKDSESGVDVAKGTYSYVLDTNERGLNLAYGLKSLLLNEDKTLRLNGYDDVDSTLSAVIDGEGSLEISSGTISLTADNDYEGATTVLAGATLLTGENGALGQTSLLHLVGSSSTQSGAVAEIHGTETVKGLNVESGATLRLGDVENDSTVQTLTLQSTGTTNRIDGSLIGGAGDQLIIQGSDVSDDFDLVVTSSNYKPSDNPDSNDNDSYKGDVILENGAMVSLSNMEAFGSEGKVTFKDQGSVLSINSANDDGKLVDGHYVHTFNNLIEGNGKLQIALENSDHYFEFDERQYGYKNDETKEQYFTGTFELQRGTFELTDASHDVLRSLDVVLDGSDAVLDIGSDNIESQDRFMKSLTLNGGTLEFGSLSIEGVNAEALSTHINLTNPLNNSEHGNLYINDSEEKVDIAFRQDATNILTPDGSEIVNAADSDGSRVVLIHGIGQFFLDDREIAAGSNVDLSERLSHTMADTAGSQSLMQAVTGDDPSQNQEHVADVVRKFGDFGYSHVSDKLGNALYVGYSIESIALTYQGDADEYGSDGLWYGLSVSASSLSDTLDTQLTGSGNIVFRPGDRLLKLGSGTAGAQSNYTGRTWVTEGAQIQFTEDNAFGNTSALRIDSTGYVDLNNHQQTVGSIEAYGDGAILGGEDSLLTITGSSTITGNNNEYKGSFVFTSDATGHVNDIAGLGTGDVFVGSSYTLEINDEQGGEVANNFRKVESQTGGTVIFGSTASQTYQLTGSNSGFSGTFQVADGSTLAASINQKDENITDRLGTGRLDLIGSATGSFTFTGGADVSWKHTVTGTGNLQISASEADSEVNLEEGLGNFNGTVTVNQGHVTLAPNGSNLTQLENADLAITSENASVTVGSAVSGNHTHLNGDFTVNNGATLTFEDSVSFAQESDTPLLSVGGSVNLAGSRVEVTVEDPIVVDTPPTADLSMSDVVLADKGDLLIALIESGQIVKDEQYGGADLILTNEDGDLVKPEAGKVQVSITDKNGQSIGTGYYDYKLGSEDNKLGISFALNRVDVNVDQSLAITGALAGMSSDDAGNAGTLDIDITGAGGFKLLGGDLTLTGNANNYQGATIVGNGTDSATLTVGEASSLGNTSDVRVMNGATLINKSESTHAGQLSVAQNGALTLQDQSVFELTDGQSVVDGALNGNGTLKLSNDAALKVNAQKAQSYRGTVSIAQNAVYELSSTGNSVTAVNSQFVSANENDKGGKVRFDGQFELNGNATAFVDGTYELTNGTSVTTSSINAIGGEDSDLLITTTDGAQATFGFDYDETKEDKYLTITQQMTEGITFAKSGSGVIELTDNSLGAGAVDVIDGGVIFGQAGSDTHYATDLTVRDGAWAAGFGAVDSLTVAGNSSFYVGGRTGYNSITESMASAEGAEGKTVTFTAGTVSNSGTIYVGNKTEAGNVPTDADFIGNELVINGDYITSTDAHGGILDMNAIISGNNDSKADHVTITGGIVGQGYIDVNYDATSSAGGKLDYLGLVSVGEGEDPDNLSLKLKDSIKIDDLYYALMYSTEQNEYYLMSSVTDPGDDPWKTEEVENVDGGMRSSLAFMQSQTFDLSLHDHVGETLYVDPITGEERSTSFWMIQRGDWTKFTNDSGQLDSDGHVYTTHLGTDLIAYRSDNATVRVGVLGSFADGQVDLTSNVNGKKSQGEFRGYSAGLYMTAQSDAQSGPFAGLQLRWNRFNNTVGLDKYHLDGLSVTAEAGWDQLLSKGVTETGRTVEWRVEPHIRAYWTDFGNPESYTTAAGETISSEFDNGMLFRLGARTKVASKKGSGPAVQAYAEANWVYNYGDYKTTVSTKYGDVTSEQSATNFAELRMGFEAQFTPNVNVWVEGHHHTGSNDYESSGAMVGFKYQW